ncbi:MAG: hypothetical protein ACP5QO_07625 [Clostridia bacterium]
MRLMDRRRHPLSDWLAILASLFVAAATASYWFIPLGTTCTGTVGSASVCTALSLAGRTPFAFTPLAIAAALGLGWTFFRLRRSILVLVGFGLAAAVFFLLSFGVDWPFIPAAALSLTAAMLPKHRLPS